jgi:UPF0755 protein
MLGWKREPFLSDLKDPDTGDWIPSEVLHRLKSVFAVTLALVVLIGGGTYAGTKAYDYYKQVRTAEDYMDKAGTADIEITIPKGATVSQIGDILVSKDVVKSAKAFKSAASTDSKASTIQAGKYKLRTQIPSATALIMLENSDNIVRNHVTVREGLRLGDILASLSQQTGVPLDQFTVVTSQHADQLDLPAYANNNPEGFLFPDTYEVPDTVAPTDLLKQMAAQFKQVAEDLNLEGNASKVNLTPLQVVTVASIVDAEVNKDQYRPMVARALYNRLAQKMPLQLDSTIAFFTTKKTTFTTAADRATANPYNTYLNQGLPPGPIDAPSKASLQAALNPADGDYLYWTVINPETGETAFAKTNDEQNANRAKLNAWCKANAGKCNQ